MLHYRSLITLSVVTDVAATKYVIDEEDVSVTCPRHARDQRIEKKVRRRLRDFAATSPQHYGDITAARVRHLRDND